MPSPQKLGMILENEISEIEALIPEIKEKITDTNKMKEENIKKDAEMKEQIGFGSSSSSSVAGSSTSTAKPIATISIKRKMEEGNNIQQKDLKMTSNG